MKDKIIKGIFKFCRFCARCFTPHYSVCPSIGTAAPVVYLVHHQNLRGPIISMIRFNIPIRPWVLSVFCNPRACFRQYYNYTFTERFSIPKVIAATAAYPLSFLVSGLMQMIEAIPVYRGSKAVVKTFEQSISTLIHGKSILICPDIDYKDTSPFMGKMYDGFLHLEKYYMKETGRHLAFVPIHISKPSHCIYVGQAIYFEAKNNFKQEMSEVYERLRQEFLRLEGQIKDRL